MSEEPWRQASRELLRALRGARSQVAFARRLGFRSNVPAAWEGGHRCPNIVELVAVAERVGVDVRGAFEAYSAAVKGGTFPAPEHCFL